MSRSSHRTLAAALLVGAGFLAVGESLADCQPRDLSVVLNTGWDESTGTVIPAGGTDDDWEVILDASGGTVPFDANVVSPHPAWLTMPNSAWITANLYGPNGFYRYKTCWCLDDDFSNPNLSFAIRADDDATVLLNGTVVLSLPDGTFNDASPLGITVNPALLHVGENCLEVIVENKYGGPTGFNLTGSMTADDGLCCDCHETDILDDAATGVDDATGGLIASGSDDDEWTVTASATGGVLPRPAGVIDTFIGWNVIPGTKWISADEDGSNGQYVYEKCWCMNPLFQNPQLSLQLLADNRADVFLNGSLIGSTPPNAFLFPATAISTGDPSLFQAGENCVTIEVTNTSGVVTGLDVAMTITATNAECCPCVDLPAGAEGWWPLNETVGVTAGELLNGHDGTWLELTPPTPPPPSPLPGMVGYSLDLDGSDDHVAVPDDPGLDFDGSQDFSFDAWIKTDNSSRQAIIHKKKPVMPTEPGYSFMTGGGVLTLEISDGANVLDCVGSIHVDDDAWHFVAATVDRDRSPDGITLYVDWMIDVVCDPTTVPGSLANAEQLYFGADPLHVPNARKWWRGQLDEIEIFRRALPTDEVLDIFFAGNSGKCPPEPCEDSTGVPVCGGACPTGSTCVAGPPPAGACQCVQAAATCGGSAPACNGLCPDPDDVCASNGPNCFCESPPQCGGPGDFPTCDDACPEGLVCDVVGNACECVEEVLPCGGTFYPECGGSCPASQVCRNIVGTNACECRPAPIPCGSELYPACNGACPANEECKPSPNQACSCIACGSVAPSDPAGPIITLEAGNEIRWTPVTCALVYNVYRGLGPRLVDLNRDGLADDYGSCYIGDVIDTRAVDPLKPQPGAIHWYLVSGENFAGEGSLGNASSGQPRQLTTVCP